MSDYIWFGLTRYISLKEKVRQFLFLYIVAR
jgi:hypothetical protein